jgi:hypothetical protein
MKWRWSWRECGRGGCLRRGRGGGTRQSATRRLASDADGHAAAAAWRRSDAVGAGRLRPWAEKRGAWPTKPEIHFSFLFSNSRVSKPFQIQILKKKKTFSRLDPKIEAVQNLILYNFALWHILNFQTDFWINDSKSNFQLKTHFSKIFLKTKFGEILNTKVAPKIMLNNSRWFEIIVKHVLLT